jgi:CheY-like chemotaxis protein/anti-sigma regulatory factor (Ser/Thr protein kinase)
VFGWTQMLRSGQFDTSQTAHALDVIARNAHAQVQLIDDLLDVSRIVAGKMRLDVGPVDLRAVIEAALDAVRPASEAKAIRLQSVLDPRAGPVTGDPGRLQQALWNLLVNAVKFTSRNGRVQVHLQRINSHVEIVVSDTGQGIAPAVLPTIFERFRQGDSGTTRAHSGLGLGLALVRHLVELHGGSVQAHSAGPGQGATFTITLPISIAQAAPGGLPRTHPTATTVVPVVTGSSLIGLRVLVVDDDPDALEMTSVILQQAGADTLASRSAAEALTVVQAWRPDVIVADIEMPEEDGYAFIRKVRALNSDQGGKIPAIAVTAYGRPEDRMRALAAGFSMHLPKPVDPGELRTVVASLAAR